MLSNLPIVMVAMTYIAALFTGVDGHRDTVSCLCHLNIKLRRYLRPSLCWDVNAPYVGSLPTFRVIPSVPLRRKTTTKIGCVTSQKSRGLKYTAAEAINLVRSRYSFYYDYEKRP